MRSVLTGPAHALDRLGQAEALDRLAVEVGDQIARLESGAIGRRVVDRRDHFHEAAFHGDLDAEPAELAAGLHLHVAEALGIEIARMRIERGQHAVDRGFDQLLVADFLDVVGSHALEDVAEQVQLAIGLGAIGLRPRVEGDEKETNRGACRQQSNSHYPLTLVLLAASHGNGLIGRPERRNSRYNSGVLFEEAVMAPTGSPASTSSPTTASIRSSPANST